MRWLQVLLLLVAMVAPAHAVNPDEILSDPALEARARVLSKELRCMVCQNQSIDDSDAPLARDLRVLVRDRLKGGDSDQQVLDFLVARYGQFVLLNPPFTWRTIWLWFAPMVVLFSTVFTMMPAIRRRRAAMAQQPQRLSAAEQARLAELLRRKPD